MKVLVDFTQQQIRSFGFAFKGIFLFFRTQVHAQIHALAIICLVPLGLWLQLSGMEWCIIVLCMGLVIVAESFNTAIEFLVDLVQPDWHPLAGKVKDLAAGTVLLAVIFAAIAWAIIFLPKLWALLPS